MSEWTRFLLQVGITSVVMPALAFVIAIIVRSMLQRALSQSRADTLQQIEAYKHSLITQMDSYTAGMNQRVEHVLAKLHDDRHGFMPREALEQRFEKYNDRLRAIDESVRELHSPQFVDKAQQVLNVMDSLLRALEQSRERRGRWRNYLSFW